MKIKIVAICGKSASGKNELLRQFKNNDNFHIIVPSTTRPPREKERNGIDYHFLSNEEFAAQLISGEMIEATEFREWFYGTNINELDPNKINIGIFNLHSLEILVEDNNIDLTIYYLDTSDKNRLLRQLNREENPDIEEIFRRYKADNADFLLLEDFNVIRLKNDDYFNLSENVVIIEKGRYNAIS